MLLLALGIWALVCTSLIFYHSTAIVIAAFVLYGLHLAALEPVQKTLAAELAPKDLVASTLGGFQMVIGLMSLPASLIAGVLWERSGMTSPFIFSLGLTAIAAFLLLWLKEKPEDPTVFVR